MKNMFCPKCGAHGQTAESYCKRCGEWLPDLDAIYIKGSIKVALTHLTGLMQLKKALGG